MKPTMLFIIYLFWNGILEYYSMNVSIAAKRKAKVVEKLHWQNRKKNEPTTLVHTSIKSWKNRFIYYLSSKNSIQYPSSIHLNATLHVIFQIHFKGRKKNTMPTMDLITETIYLPNLWYMIVLATQKSTFK